MVGRNSIGESYRIFGWSFRLFPDVELVEVPPNRGSAFNSAFAMSFVPGIDATYCISGKTIYRFCGGTPFQVTGDR
jgi:hypothetical protein